MAELKRIYFCWSEAPKSNTWESAGTQHCFYKRTILRREVMQHLLGAFPEGLKINCQNCKTETHFTYLNPVCMLTFEQIKPVFGVSNIQKSSKCLCFRIKCQQGRMGNEIANYYLFHHGGHLCFVYCCPDNVQFLESFQMSDQAWIQHCTGRSFGET